MRICNLCNRDKPLDSFSILKYTKCGNPVRRARCKSCRSLKRSKSSEKRENIIPSLEGEVWKDILGYEGTYEISTKGRVKSLSRIRSVTNENTYYSKEKLLKTFPQNGGYIRVALKKKLPNKYDNRTIHRLVAQAFLENPHSLPEVNHIDGVKANNVLENLEWISSTDNHLHAFRIGLKKPSGGRKKS